MIASASAETRRIAGLDSIRFVCALVVALGHFSGNYAPDLAPLLGDRLATLADQFLGVAFNGPAAVIVFFVLSGFVVHLPQAVGRPLGLSEYFARRYLRILPPALLIAVVYARVGLVPPDGNWNDTVLWSILCELIYYTLYPLLVRLRLPFGWITLATFLLTLALAVANADRLFAANNNYVAFGYWTWVIGAPCWLAGCWIAENYHRFPSVRPASLWTVRLAILVASVVLRVMKFHLPPRTLIGSNVISLTLFAMPVTFWLALEAAFRRDAVPALDRLGRASYSLYLIHPVALVLLAPWLAGQGLGALLLYLLAVGLGTTAFYMLVERNAHSLARRLGRKLREQNGRKATEGRE